MGKETREIDFTIDEIGQAAREFLQHTGKDRIFLFEGEMGAGKNTFIAEICRQMGVKDDCGSPTFSLVNEYLDASGNPIYHFDFYRVESAREAFEIGADDYFTSGNLCFVEWPDRLGDFTPEGSRIVKISVSDNGKRKIIF